MSSPSFFLLGASGYIGGSILAELVKAYPESPITLLYRSPSQEEALKSVSSKITLVKGDLDAVDVIVKATKEADITINAANCDHLPSVRATMEGLKWRTEQGKGGRLVHTSGTGELIETTVPVGDFDPTIYDDTNEKQLSSLPADRAHLHVDRELIAALNKKEFYGYIILPSTIYGKGSGPVHQLSQQIPTQARYALKNGKVGYIGAGLNVWKSVHIDDLVQLYIKTIALVAKEDFTTSLPNLPSPSYGNSYIFACSPNTFRWKGISEWISEILSAKQPSKFKEGDLVSVAAKDSSVLTGSNSVGDSNRAKELFGWSTRDVTKKDVEWDVEQVLKEF